MSWVNFKQFKISRKSRNLSQFYIQQLLADPSFGNSDFDGSSGDDSEDDLQNGSDAMAGNRPSAETRRWISDYNPSEYMLSNSKSYITFRTFEHYSNVLNVMY